MAKGNKLSRKRPKGMTGAKWNAQLSAADDAQRAMDEAGLLARSALYDAPNSRVVVELSRGASVGLPVQTIPELRSLNENELAQVEVDESGTGLRWEAFDLDVSILGWIELEFGRPLTSLRARRAGRVSSEAKIAAARANGAMGGRPKNPRRAEQLT